MNLRKVLIDLCRKQTEYTETAHLPEHYYTTRYSLHEDKLSDFMSDDKIRKVLSIKFRKEWEYTMKEFKEIHFDFFDRLEMLELLADCVFDRVNYYCDHQIIINFKQKKGCMDT